MGQVPQLLYELLANEQEIENLLFFLKRIIQIIIKARLKDRTGLYFDLSLNTLLSIKVEVMVEVLHL
jgi:hypothetical protein